MRLPTYLETGIVECGNNCKCCADKCCNRVVQRGLQFKVQVSNTHKRGHGVRAMTDISASTFVAAFNGQIIDEHRTENRKYNYFFTLGPKTSKKSRDQTESDALVPSVKKAGTVDLDVVQEFLNFFPKKVTWSNDSDCVLDTENEVTANENPTEFIIDSMFYGNFSRFFNVSHFEMVIGT